MQKEADAAIEDFATGKTRNIHETMIVVNNTDLAFLLTMQVRNKIVEAYKGGHAHAGLI
ncbi:MAG: flagellar hook-basal body complex protein FliE [Nitrospinaceae bacterium]|nr:flagellar hook-basal body complex protein FliE [Nitrospinaceae bacterium]